MQYDTKNQSAEHNCVKAQKVHTMRNATLNIIMWLLAFVLVLTIMAVLPMNNGNKVNNAVAQGVADDGTTATSFAGGTGTEEDPYQIATPMQLRLLSETTDYATYWGSGIMSGSNITITNAVYYELTADLEMTSTNWTPIGNGSQVFFGYFDGQGHTITFANEVTTEGVLMEIGSDDTYLAGLFGYVARGSISNLGVNWQGGLIVENNVVDASFWVGSIVGYVREGIIINCYNTGSITASGENGELLIGSIVGLVMGTINNCYNSGSITASGDNVRLLGAGGIAGSITGAITNCYNTGSISGTVSGENGGLLIGSIVGQVVGTISNCYNTGSISGTTSGENVRMLAVGGIVGGSYTGTIVNCFSVEGQIEAIGTAQQMGVGGILGMDMGSSTITNCYYDNELVGTASTLDGTRVTGLADLMKVESNFTNGSFVDSASTSHPWSTEPIQTTNPITQEPVEIQPQWDFENVWGMSSTLNYGYPHLLNMPNIKTPQSGSTNQLTITNDTEKAVLVVISSDASTAMFKVQGGATKTYTMPIALDTTYKVSVIGGTITSVPTISGGEITDQQGNTFNVTFTESGSLGINV